jgi:glucose-1-phosphate adenylyltransferase
MVLAGGQGERLFPLTRKRAKPAVPFGGMYRIIDFTLSNCLNSGLTHVYVLTQHKSLSLDRHLHHTWSIMRPERGEFIQSVPPQHQLVSRWYAGTADAVFQNLELLDQDRPEHVVILSGDHVYRMDYERLLAFHVERDADLTLATTQVPCAEARRMGVLEADDDDRITAFAEKPEFPVPLRARPDRARVNMGIYVFRTETLVRAVIADAKSASVHDFGHSIIPTLVPTHRVYAFDVLERCPAPQHYWQDVGTLDTYFAANMDLLAADPAFDIFTSEWPIRHHGGQYPPALMRNVERHEARARDSILSPGSIVAGGSVTRSILSPGVVVEAEARVDQSILLPGVRVGARSVLERVIVDENVVIPPDTVIGTADADRRHFTVTPGGVTVVPEGTLIE